MFTDQVIGDRKLCDEECVECGPNLKVVGYHPHPQPARILGINSDPSDVNICRISQKARRWISVANFISIKSNTWFICQELTDLF